MFEPIAIVGRACLLPQASSPGELWQLVSAMRSAITTVPSGRFLVPPEDVLVAGGHTLDKTHTTKGGYVTHAATLDARDQSKLAGLDPLFGWVTHTAREAANDAGYSDGFLGTRASAVLGHLSFPTEFMANWGERETLLGLMGFSKPQLGALHQAPVDARNRFMSGLPAHVLAEQLGLSHGAFAIDAACASSLYALALAARQLQQHTVDVALACAVNRADPLFIHNGFTSLMALSKTGHSRPFDRRADGLLPAEGACAFVLMRLKDAVEQKRHVHGVVTGIGLSNDGRSKNLLAPASAGQQLAIQRAYAMAQRPALDVDFVECHATGTPTGDRTELVTLLEAQANKRDLPVSSLKGNLGHLITAAGASSLIKVLEAFRHETLPPSLGCDEPLDLLQQGPLQLIDTPQPYPRTASQPRRAGVSAFGFGGNNAHVVVEEYVPERIHVFQRAPVESAAPSPLCIVAVAHALANANGIDVDLAQLRFPPNDLREALPQQLLAFQAARDAAHSARERHADALPSHSTGVFVGFGTDVKITTPGIRFRADAIARTAHHEGGHEAAVMAIRQAAMAPMSAAAVLGAMPNIPANRINVQEDVRGMGFTVSAEQHSGVRALDVAEIFLRSGELDAAIVAASDDETDPRAQAALRALGQPSSQNARGVAVVVMLEQRALALGLTPIATIELSTSASASDGAAPDTRTWPHVTQGLMAVVDAATRTDANPTPSVLRLEAMGAPPRLVRVTAQTPPAPASGAVQALRIAMPTLPQPPRFEPATPSPSVMSPPPALPAVLPAAWHAQHKRAATATVVHAPTTPTATEHVVVAQPESTSERHSDAHAPLIVWMQQQRQLQNASHQHYLTAAQHGHDTFVSTQAQLLARLAATSTDVAVVAPSASAEWVTAPTPTAEAVAPSSAHVLYDRTALEALASGPISAVLGPEFQRQDNFRRQVRMPQPPLLLADRVVSINARKGVLEKHRSIQTETDIGFDAWYLHDGHIPPGILIETGQADLLLVSYMGVDFENQGERVYRLLGCDLTYTGALPAAGSTVAHDIHVDGYANAPSPQGGETRIFFFHSETTDKATGASLLRVSNGQAGFFTDAELAVSGGVLWKPEDESTDTINALPHDAAPRVSRKTTLQKAELEAFARGDAATCFGDGFERCSTHVRTPRISDGQMLLVHRVTSLSADGGPWRRGYVRAEFDLTPDTWFFNGHFKDDPCMPGTVMFDGCLQVLAIALASQGYTLDKDGFRFTPALNRTFPLRCRGQATPSSQQLVYEIFTKQVRGGEEPTIVADILVTVDGLKSLHCSNVELVLTRDFPLSSRPDLSGAAPKHDGQDAVGGFTSAFRDEACVFDQTSLLATGIGKPSQAFPGLYDSLDTRARIPRLPGPPYHFMSRVLDVTGPAMGALWRGENPAPQEAVVAYDVPPDAWYFDDNAAGGQHMPFAVLLEVALQPCGWLSSYVGSALTSASELCYRNLDGKARMHREVPRDVGTLLTRATLTKSSASSGMIIQEFSFAVTLRDGSPVYDGTTVFGFFPLEAFENQAGIPTPDVDKARMRLPLVRPVDAHAKRPQSRLSLPAGRLRVIDRVGDVTPSETGLALRTEKTVSARDWFFQAHFFTDPVQPGSLGLEAMVQGLMWAACELAVDEGMKQPRFVSLTPGVEHVWKYRGQVVPENHTIHTDVKTTRITRDASGVTLVADGSLWVDGKRIYTCNGFSIRVVDGAA